MELGPFPMTALEKILKVLLDQRPDIKNTIPDAEALADYISWMAEEFGETYKGKYTVENVLTLPVTSGQYALAERMIRDPLDRQAMSSLSADFASQSEHWSIQTGRDISISRMLRYMPGQWHTSEYFEVYYAPEAVEIAERQKEGRRYLMLLNYLPEAQEITLRREMRELLADKPVSGAISLPPFGILVLEA